MLSIIPNKQYHLRIQELGRWWRGEGVGVGGGGTGNKVLVIGAGHGVRSGGCEGSGACPGSSELIDRRTGQNVMVLIYYPIA